MIKILFALFLSFPLLASTVAEIQEALPGDSVWEGVSEDQDVMLCLHGFGMDKMIGSYVHDTQLVTHHIFSFNFPDHGMDIDISKPETLCFGSVEELKPVIERLHTCITTLGANRIHLYGFSAGGGCAVNVLAALKKHRFRKELGLSAHEMDTIFEALERGTVILDCPLKSIDEILDEVEPENHYLAHVADIYKSNDLRPIDSLLKLKGSELNVLLILMQPDAILSNRDDALFIERLEEANRLGNTVVMLGHEGIHVPTMLSFMEGYERLKEEIPFN